MGFLIIKLVPYIMAAVSGIAMAFQGSINSGLAKIIGLLEATFVVQGVGLVLVAVLLFGFGLGEGTLAHYAEAPWYLYLGGILGVLIVYLVVRSIPQVGVAPATTAIILGQVLTAAVIDHLGLFGLKTIPFTWYRVAGVFLMAGGAFLILKK